MKKHQEGWGCIYLITNLVNGKRYAGYDTTGDPENHRWKHHKWQALVGKSKYPVHCALRKAWKRDKCWDNFKFEVIWRGPIEDLPAKEIYYVKKLHTYICDPLGDCSYNMTLGGDGVVGHKYSKKSKRQMSASGKRRFEDLAVRERTSLATTLQWENLAVREKMCAAQQARRVNPADRKKTSKGMKRHFKDNPEACERISAAGILRYKDPAEREKTSAALKCHYAEHPETREKLSVIQVRRFKDLVEREKMSAAQMKPEVRKKKSDALGLYWAKPDSHEKASIAIKQHYENNPEAHKKSSEASLRGWKTHRANTLKLSKKGNQ